MPEKLGEKGLRELRVLPAAVLQKLKSIFADVRVLDQLLDVAVGGEKLMKVLQPLLIPITNLVRFNNKSSASADNGSS